MAMRKPGIFILPVWRGAALAIFSIVTALFLPCTAHSAEGEANYKRSEAKYVIPDVVLVNQNGEKVRLRELLNAKKPVLLDFIYGTCTTICPVLSAGFSHFQKKLGPEVRNVVLVSVTIDPENDTPEVMRAYLKRYRARHGWDFLTGSRADIDRVMKAFDAYVPNKMAHYPLTLLKAPRDDRWVRIYGLVGTSELIAEYHKIMGQK